MTRMNCALGFVVICVAIVFATASEGLIALSTAPDGSSSLVLYDPASNTASVVAPSVPGIGEDSFPGTATIVNGTYYASYKHAGFTIAVDLQSGVLTRKIPQYGFDALAYDPALKQIVGLAGEYPGRKTTLSAINLQTLVAKVLVQTDPKQWLPDSVGGIYDSKRGIMYSSMINNKDGRNYFVGLSARTGKITSHISAPPSGGYVYDAVNDIFYGVASAGAKSGWNIVAFNPATGTSQLVSAQPLVNSLYGPHYASISPQRRMFVVFAKFDDNEAITAFGVSVVDLASGQVLQQVLNTSVPLYMGAYGTW